MYPVGLRNTRISADSAQILPGHWWIEVNESVEQTIVIME